MSIHGVGPRREIETLESLSGEDAQVSAPAAPAARGGAPALAPSRPALSRDDIQRMLLERSAAASAVSGASAAGAPAVDEKHAELRAAFDRIDAPSGPAKSYRMDRNVEAFASRWKTLEGAQKSFDTTYFIWEDDVFGMAYLGHMLKKANDGLQIRGMMDATGDAGGMKGFKASMRGQDYLQELVNVDPERVKFGIFNPLLKKDLTNLKSLVASNHDKLAIADGKTVETGGRNMAAHYYSDPKDHKGVYRDTDIHLESRAAGIGATKAFEAEFNNEEITQQIKPELFGNWAKRDIELLGTYAMMDQWLKAPALTEAEKEAIRGGDQALIGKLEAEVVKNAVAALPSLGIDREPSRSDMAKLREMAKELVSNPELRGTYDIRHEEFDGEVKMIDKVSASSKGEDAIGRALIDLASSAKESIYIHNPYVVLTEPALEALAEAGKRGVKVIFGTNSPESTDSALTQAYFLEDWPHILAKIPNSQIIVATGDQKHHAKTFVIDGVLTGISTYNADWVSMEVNSEVVALQWGEEFAKDTIESYERTMADPAHGALEYKIKRDEQGRALIKDGKPIVEFGPENHVPKDKLEGLYARLRPAANFAREHIDSLAPLNHRPLDPTRDHVRVVQ